MLTIADSPVTTRQSSYYVHNAGVAGRWLHPDYMLIKTFLPRQIMISGHFSLQGLKGKGNTIRMPGGGMVFFIYSFHPFEDESIV